MPVHRQSLCLRLMGCCCSQWLHELEEVGTPLATSDESRGSAQQALALRLCANAARIKFMCSRRSGLPWLSAASDLVSLGQAFAASFYVSADQMTVCTAGGWAFPGSQQLMT